MQHYCVSAACFTNLSWLIHRVGFLQYSKSNKTRSENRSVRMWLSTKTVCTCSKYSQNFTQQTTCHKKTLEKLKKQQLCIICMHKSWITICFSFFPFFLMVYFSCFSSNVLHIYLKKEVNKFEICAVVFRQSFFSTMWQPEITWINIILIADVPTLMYEHSRCC